jgi:hypothetical protein
MSGPPLIFGAPWVGPPAVVHIRAPCQNKGPAEAGQEGRRRAVWGAIRRVLLQPPVLHAGPRPLRLLRPRHHHRR